MNEQERIGALLRSWQEQDDMDLMDAHSAHDARTRQMTDAEHVLHDPVNSPEHYAASDIECIDAMVAAHGVEAVQTYALLAATKYVWRAGKKDDKAQDIKKAIWYLRYSIGDDPREGSCDTK